MNAVCLRLIGLCDFRVHVLLLNLISLSLLFQQLILDTVGAVQSLYDLLMAVGAELPEIQPVFTTLASVAVLVSCTSCVGQGSGLVLCPG